MFLPAMISETVSACKAFVAQFANHRGRCNGLARPFCGNELLGARLRGAILLIGPILCAR